MSLVTLHWSASPPVRLKAYHVEVALKSTLTPSFLESLRAWALQPSGFNHVPWVTLASYFDIWKNDDLTASTEYGTWHLNHDPRDNSPNIELAAMCMDGATTTNFGPHPFIIGHAWLLAALAARVCHLKGISPTEGFEPAVAPAILQNGPIFNVSTHGERAIQTQNPGVAHPELGYFVGSGDPDSRWDLAILDPEYIEQGQKVTASQCKLSANWLRRQVNAIYQQGKTYGFPAGMMGMDAEVTQ